MCSGWRSGLSYQKRLWHYGVLSLDSYSRLTEPEEYAMDVADAAAESTDERLTHEQVFNSLRRKINA